MRDTAVPSHGKVWLELRGVTTRKEKSQTTARNRILAFQFIVRTQRDGSHRMDFSFEMLNDKLTAASLTESVTLKMEAVTSSETSDNTYQTR